MTAPRPARSHEPVMLNEAIEGLAVHPGGSYVDATVGLGGHAAAIIEAASPGGRLLGIDCDADALAEAGKRLAAHGDAVVLAQGNFRDIVELCDEHDFTPIDGILLDLGVSSPGRVTVLSGLEVGDEVAVRDPTRSTTAGESKQPGEGTP